MSFGNIVGSASFQLVTGKRGFTLGLQDAQGEARTAVDQIANTLGGIGRAATQSGLALTAGLTVPILGLSNSIFDIGRSFESAFAGVAKTFPGTNAQLLEFRDAIRDMANEMPSTREEIAGVAEVAGQLGISATGLEDFTRVMVQLGETTNLTAEQAATSLARLANILQTNEQDFDRLGATVVDLGNNFATTEAEIVNMATRIAGAGQVVGLTEAQVLSLATSLSSVGVRIEAGGSAISRVFITMANAVAQGSEDLELFAGVAGVSVDQFAQAFEQDATQALSIFLQGLNRLDQEGQNVFTTLDDLELGEIRVRDALLRLAGAQDLMNEALARGDTAWGENSALVVEYGKRVETLDSQLQILRNQLTDIAVDLFDAFRPQILARIEQIGDKLSEVAEQITEFVNSLDDETKELIVTFAAVAAAIGPAVLAIGGISIALSTLLNPIALVVAALAGLGAAFVVYEQNQDTITAKAPALAAALDSIKTNVVGLAEEFKDFPAGEILNTLLGTVEILTAAFLTLLTAVNLLLDSLRLLDSIEISFDPQALATGDAPISVGFSEEGLDRYQQRFDDFVESMDNNTFIFEDGLGRMGQSIDIFGNKVDATTVEIQDIWRKRLSPSGLGFDQFVQALDGLVTQGARDLDLFKQRAAQFVVDFRTLESQGVNPLFTAILNAIGSAETEMDVIGAVWKAVTSGIVEDNQLVQEALRGSAQEMKFLEQNSFDYATSASTVTEQLNLQEIAANNALSAILLYKDGINNAQNAIATWNQDLANNEKAIEITKRLIEETGDPTGELTDQLDILVWQNERLSNGIKDDLEPAFAGSVAAGAKLQKQLEDLDEAYKNDKISLEEYEQLTGELLQKAAESQDPFAQMTGDIGKIADAMQDGIEAFKDLLRELGLLKDETGEPVEANFTTNARDTADDIGGVGEEISELPDEKPVSILSVLSGQNDLEDYQGDLKDLPEEILTKLLANTDDADTKTRDQIELALGYARGEYRAEIYAETSEANKGVADLSQNTIGFVEGTYEATVDADTAQAQTNVDTLLTRVGALIGQSYSVTVDANIDPALEELAVLRANLPRSPAEEGPLAFIPDWSFIFETLPESAKQFTDETLQHLQNFVGLASSTLDLFQKTIDFSISARGFSGLLPSLDFIQELAAFSASATAEIGFLAEQFEGEFLDAANAFNTAAQSSLSTLISAVDAINALLELGGFRVGQLQLDQISDIKFLVEHLVNSIGDTAALMVGEKGLGFVQLADQFAQSAQSSLALIVPAIEALQAITQLGGRRISNADFDGASDIKFFVEHLVGSIGDSAAYILGERGLTSGGTFFADAEEIANAGIAAFELVSGIQDVLDALSSGIAISADDYDLVSDIKFFVEHLVASFGDSARFLEATREDAGFVDAAERFAAAVESSLGSLVTTLEFITLLSSTLEDITVGSEQIAEYAAFLANVALRISNIFEEVAQEFNETIEGSIERLAAAVGNATSALSSTLTFIAELAQNTESISIESEQIEGYARDLAEKSVIISRIFDEVASDFEETVEGSIERLATAVSNSTGALGNTLSFLVALSEGIGSVNFSSEQIREYARQLASNAVDIAEEFTIATRNWSGEVHPQSEQLSDAISSSLGAIGNALSFLGSLTDALAREEKIDFGSSIRGLASQLAQRAREAAEAFINVTKTWEIDEDVKGKVNDAATVIQDSFGALGSVIQFMNQVTDDDFQIRGGQLREAARRIAELGVNVGNIFAEVGGSLSEGSRAGLDAYAQWFANIEGIFSFLADIQSQAPDAVQNAYTFRDAAREIALAIQTGTDALLAIGDLADLSVQSNISSTTSTPSLDDSPNTGGSSSGNNGNLTVNLDIDGETFQTFIIDTVNETVEEIF